MQLIKVPFLVCLAISPLAGCVVSGGSMEEMVDRSVVTNSIAPAAPAAPAVAPDQASDRNTVRNAVSAADLHAATEQPMAWANTDTGASGVITAIREVRAGDMICRQFQTSRQRFDGVALYKGEACTKGQGEWTLTQFNEGT
jgi:surface antigen